MPAEIPFRTVVIVLGKVNETNLDHAIWKARDRAERLGYEAWRVDGPDGLALAGGKRK